MSEENEMTAFDEGYRAFHMGFRLDENPYPGSEPESEDWMDGWNAAAKPPRESTTNIAQPDAADDWLDGKRATP